MLFVITGFDREEARDVRQKLRPEHLAYLKAKADQIRVGGPLLDQADQPVGSMLIIEAPDQAAAEAFANDDPYRREGVFERVEIRPWRAALGAWLG